MRDFLNKDKGFTLIELLVVIAIIAILAAILFPVFAQAREKARQSSCLSNLKQFGTAVRMYTDDYDQTLPPVRVTTSDGIYGGNTATLSAMDLVYPYVKNYKLYDCPSVNRDSRYVAPKDRWAQWMRDAPPVSSYIMPIWMTSWANNTFLLGSSETQLEVPAQTVSIADGGYWWFVVDGAWNTGITVSTTKPITLVGTGGGTIIARHNDGANVGFWDGHAGYMKPNDLAKRPTSRPYTLYWFSPLAADKVD